MACAVGTGRDGEARVLVSGSCGADAHRDLQVSVEAQAWPGYLRIVLGRAAALGVGTRVLLILFAQGEGRAEAQILLPVAAVLDLVHVDWAERFEAVLALIGSLRALEEVRLLRAQVFHLFAIHCQFCPFLPKLAVFAQRCVSAQIRYYYWRNKF